ncbi:MAG: helix-turn-helix domain-containing protein [Gemmataceae bacterium]|nr:helix-turn-helix domain-containing protein [Gemmataceae bacterium]
MGRSKTWVGLEWLLSIASRAVPSLPERFGKVLRRRRLAIGVSQEDLAAQAGLHRNYVGLLERGQRVPTITVVQQLAAALGTSMSKLLADVERSSG